MFNEDVPNGATRHMISVKLAMRLFFRDDTTPHQIWNMGEWMDLDAATDVRLSTYPIDQECEVKDTGAYISGMRIINSNKKWKYD